MKRRGLLVLGVVAVGVMVALVKPSDAGYQCDLAKSFKWDSPAQNTACAYEWLWEHIL